MGRWRWYPYPPHEGSRPVFEGAIAGVVVIVVLIVLAILATAMYAVRRRQPAPDELLRWLALVLLVANLVNDNGANAVNITLTDDAVWQVTGTSLISSLTLQDQAQVNIPAGVVLTCFASAAEVAVRAARS